MNDSLNDCGVGIYSFVPETDIFEQKCLFFFIIYFDSIDQSFTWNKIACRVFLQGRAPKLNKNVFVLLAHYTKICTVITRTDSSSLL